MQTLKQRQMLLAVAKKELDEVRKKRDEAEKQRLDAEKRLGELKKSQLQQDHEFWIYSLPIQLEVPTTHRAHRPVRSVRERVSRRFAPAFSDHQHGHPDRSTALATPIARVEEASPPLRCQPEAYMAPCDATLTGRADFRPPGLE